MSAALFRLAKCRVNAARVEPAATPASQASITVRLVLPKRQLSLLLLVSKFDCSHVRSAPQPSFLAVLTCYSTSNAAETSQHQEQRGKDWRGKLHNQSCIIQHDTCISSLMDNIEPL